MRLERNLKAVLMAMMRASLNAFPVLALILVLITFGVVQADAAALRVVSFNMGTHRGPIPTLTQVVRAVRAVGGQPDVLLAQEIPWRVKYEDLARELGFEYYISGRDQKPMTNRGIFSRTSLGSAVAIPTENAPRGRDHPGSGSGALCATTVIQGKEILLCSVHLETIREEMAQGESLRDLGVIFKYVKNEFFNDNIRSRSVDTIIDRISELGAKRVIIGGDFNTFPLSKAIRKMNAYFDDAFWPSAAFFRGTYVDFPLFIKPRIDFIFHSAGMSVRDCGVHEYTAGDHVPVSAVILFD